VNQWRSVVRWRRVLELVMVLVLVLAGGQAVWMQEV
jgi:hypothetical protein